MDLVYECRIHMNSKKIIIKDLNLSPEVVLLLHNVLGHPVNFKSGDNP